MFETVSRIVGCMIPIALVGAYATDWRPNMDFSTKTAAQVRSECSWVYRVGPGDTAESVAGWAIGTGGQQILIDANPNLLKSAAIIKPGDKLVLPCRKKVVNKVDAVAEATPPEPAKADAMASNATPNAPVVTASLKTPAPGAAELDNPASADLGNNTAASIAMVASLDPGASFDLDSSPATNAVWPAAPSADGSIHILTGSDFTPFVNSGLPDGTMITDMVYLAMSGSGLEKSFKIAAVDDWSVHLDLLDRKSYDLGFPWYRPDCEKSEGLGPSLQWLCEAFEFSDPLVEVTVGYYVQPHDPLLNATRYDQLAGHRLCRPASHFTFDLLQQGLMYTDTTLITPPQVSDCLAMLQRGEVDVATFSKSIAGVETARLSALGYIAEIPALVADQSLHVVAPKSKPQAVAYLGQINKGIARLNALGHSDELATRQNETKATEVR